MAMMDLCFGVKDGSEGSCIIECLDFTEMHPMCTRERKQIRDNNINIIQ